MAKEGYALIHRAAKNGHLRVLEFLLENGVDVDHETNQGTALSIAAQHGHLKTFEYLIKCEADIERGSPFGEAIVSGYQSVVKLLLEKGADTNGIHKMKARWGSVESNITMLGLVVIRSGHPFVKILLERGADVDLVAEEGESTPLVWAIARDREEIFALLLQ